MTQKVRFDFNTALSPVREEDGAWERASHKAMALKIRGYIMSRPSGDGISNMIIDRFAMSVDYDLAVTTQENVISAVQEAIVWAASQEGFFPLRGDKTPTANLNMDDARRPTSRVNLYVDLPTDLYPYPVTSEEGDQARSGIARDLVAIDGACGFGVRQRRIRLEIETSTLSVETARLHIVKMLNGYANSRKSPYLPFVRKPFFRKLFFFSKAAFTVEDFDWQQRAVME